MSPLSNDKALYLSLKRIMDRLGLNQNQLPTQLSQWQDFINRVNNSFYDAEQERYLLERSMEISSKEFYELTDRFESAESIAHIGHWTFYPNENKIFWSKEMYNIFGLNMADILPSRETFLALIHDEDRERIMQFSANAIQNGVAYETEYRMYRPSDKKLIWVYAKGLPLLIRSSQETALKYPYNLTGILMDITERKESEKKLFEANQQLVQLSRQAGMSEIAAMVLHNIGNILNSAGVSVVMAAEALENSEISSLSKVSTLMREQIALDPNYLVSHEKGKLIPGYLIELSDVISKERDEVAAELKNLTEHLDHIKKIVDAQNDIAGIRVVNEPVSMVDICETALKMCYTASSNDVEIIREYDFKEPIFSDKTKIMQIMVNLIRNALDSLKYVKNTQSKKIILSIRESEQKNLVEFSVKDNGVGIPKNQIDKIFLMGFTTKINGHGFGLHNSANAAKEMHGSLVAKSDGAGCGATFILFLAKNMLDGE